MSYPVVVDKIRRIQDQSGHTLDVRPWPDGPNSVGLMNSSKESEEYFGGVEVVMDPEFARLIGQALIECADEVQGQTND